MSNPTADRLIHQLQTAANAIYLVAEQPVAVEISALLTKAWDRIQRDEQIIAELRKRLTA